MMLCRIHVVVATSPSYEFTRTIRWPNDKLPTPIEVTKAKMRSPDECLTGHDGSRIWWDEEQAPIVEVLPVGDHDHDHDPAPVGACPACDAQVVLKRTTMVSGHCGQCGQPVISDETVDAVGATMDEKP